MMETESNHTILVIGALAIVVLLVTAMTAVFMASALVIYIMYEAWGLPPTIAVVWVTSLLLVLIRLGRSV